MSVGFKHKLSYGGNPIGDMMSVSTGDVDLKIAGSSLNISDVIKLNENPQIDLEKCSKFYFSVPERYDPNYKIRELLKHLTEKSTRIAYMQLNSKGVIGLLLPITESSDRDIIKNKYGFICYVCVPEILQSWGSFVFPQKQVSDTSPRERPDNHHHHENHNKESKTEETHSHISLKRKSVSFITPEESESAASKRLKEAPNELNGEYNHLSLLPPYSPRSMYASPRLDPSPIDTIPSYTYSPRTSTPATHVHGTSTTTISHLNNGNISSGNGSNKAVVEEEDEGALVESHYNILERNQEERIESQLYHLRCLNNYFKSSLIAWSINFITSIPTTTSGTSSSSSSSTRNADRLGMNDKSMKRQIAVMDYACGKGGDLMKWFKPYNTNYMIEEYVGVDIANNSLKHFHDRIQDLLKSGKQQSITSKIKKLIRADLCKEDLTQDILPTYEWFSYNDFHITHKIPLSLPNDTYDIISAQFCIHYMFRNQETVTHFLEQISKHLRPGGVLIATTIDCRVLADKLAQVIFTKSNTISTILSENDSNDNKTTTATTTTTTPVTGIDTNISYSAAGTLFSDKEYNHEIIIRNEYNDILLKIIFESNSGWQRLLHSTSSSSSSSSSSSYKGTETDTTTPTTTATYTNLINQGDVYNKTTNNKNVNDNDSFRLQAEEDDAGYGIRYYFHLYDQPPENTECTSTGTTTTAAVSAPEYVVPIGPALCQLAEKYQLKLIKHQNFHEYYQECQQNTNIKINGASSFNGYIPAGDWEIARMYAVVVFQKMGDDDGSVPDISASSTTGATTTFNHLFPHVTENSTISHTTAAFSSNAFSYFQDMSYGQDSENTSAYFAPPSPSNYDGMNMADDTELRFAPHSSDGPPSDFAPHSPDGPPPDFAPHSPDGPPPDFAPHSPDGPPPDFAPHSPDGPPPDFAPHSPDGPPPDFAPHSPDGPPPDFAPHSPDGPPPDFAPHSPDEPPPDFAPHSPDGPPPDFAPHSPDGPPPTEYDESLLALLDANKEDDTDDNMKESELTVEDTNEEDDEYLHRVLAIRALAMEIAGGEEIWDQLDDVQTETLMEEATAMYEKRHGQS